MQIEALQLYCDVVRFHSFSRGAEVNHVLQSSASEAVRHIEENLDVALIDRSCRPWQLTDAGKVFYEGCRDVVDRYHEVVAKVRNVRASVDSVIRVSAIYSVNLRDMTQCIQQFNRTHPDARVEIEYQHPERVVERVLNDEVNLGIISYPEEHRTMATIPWRDEPMVLVCSPEHRFAGYKKLAVDHLAGETLVGFDAGLTIGKKIERYLKDHGVEPHVTMRFDNIEAIKRAVEAGSGVALLPRPTVEHEVQLGTLRLIELANCTLCRPLGIIHRKGRKLYANTEAFIATLKNGTSSNLVFARDGEIHAGNGGKLGADSLTVNGNFRGPRRAAKHKP